jgi:hypothetical protein
MACLFASGLVKAQSAGDTAGDNAKASSQKAAASGAASSELKELKDAISTQQQIQQACRGPRPSRQRRSGTCGSRRSAAICRNYQGDSTPNFTVTDRGRLVFVRGR